MKKVLSLLLLASMLLCAVKVSAEENSLRQIAYEFSFGSVYVEIDPSAFPDEGKIKEELLNIEGVDEVFEYTAGVFLEDQSDGFLYWSIKLLDNSPELFFSVKEQLEQRSFVLRITQYVMGVELPGNDRFDLSSVVLCADTSYSPDFVLSDLRRIPEIHSCRVLSAKEQDQPYFMYLIWIREPVGENFPSLVETLKSREYCKDTLGYSYLAILPREDFYGDADLDHQVTAADARKILRISVHLDPLPEDSLARTLCDVDSDGSVTAADARAALRTAIKLDPLNTFIYEMPKYDGVIL